RAISTPGRMAIVASQYQATLLPRSHAPTESSRRTAEGNAQPNRPCNQGSFAGTDLWDACDPQHEACDQRQPHACPEERPGPPRYTRPKVGRLVARQSAIPAISSAAITIGMARSPAPSLRPSPQNDAASVSGATRCASPTLGRDG